MPDLRWPERWQREAIEATEPYVDSEHLIEVVVGDPATSVDGSLVAGYVFTTDSGELRIIHDRSGRPDVYDWPLLAGPVLRVAARLPKHRRTIVYTHPEWEPRRDR